MIRVAALIIALVPFSASAQQPLATYAQPPVWGAPPMPRPTQPSHSDRPKLPPQLSDGTFLPPLAFQSERRVQDKIFQRLAYCSLDLTPTERLLNCKDI